MVFASAQPFFKIAKEPWLAICVHPATNLIHIADHLIGLVAPSMTTFLGSVETHGDGVVGELGDGKNIYLTTTKDMFTAERKGVK